MGPRGPAHLSGTIVEDRPTDKTCVSRRYYRRQSQPASVSRANWMEVYLDSNSTSTLDPAAAADMGEALRAGYANPASQHGPGRRARQALAVVREQLASFLGARAGHPADRLILTSGGTEANNLALFGLAGKPPGSIVVSSIEHPSVAQSAAKLQSLGFGIRRLPVNSAGIVQVDRLAELIDGTTRIVCVMLANNETGILQPVEQVVEVCRRAGVWVHTDAVQAVGKIPVHFAELGVSSMSLGAHKFNGPRGIGALLIRPDLPLSQILYGGAQQLALRPGTEDVALAIGMCTALANWQAHGVQRRDSMRKLRDRFELRLLEQVGDAVIIGRDSIRLPQTCLVSFPGVNRQALFMAADLQGIAISTGSACASGSSEPSPTAQAMGMAGPVVEGAVRISFGFQTTQAELEFAADQIAQIVQKLRQNPALSRDARPSRRA